MLMENIAFIWPRKLRKWHYVAEAPTRAITVRFEFTDSTEKIIKIFCFVHGIMHSELTLYNI